jgi:hypothetical protein
MTDLVKRLRDRFTYDELHYAPDPLLAEAADRIEALGLAVVPGWQDIASAPRDRTHVLVKVRDDAFADSHFRHYAGRCFVAFHEGVSSGSGYDLGWALFPGFGGVSGGELEGWMPLPAAPNEGEG